MTAAERRARTAEADEVCGRALKHALAGGEDTGIALVAVGGYGRGELAPHSDLDVVLVHGDGVDVDRVAERVWYPLWDAGFEVDHSVRALAEVEAHSAGDLRVALGLLDVRHVAGDPNLALVLRAELLARWRRSARRQLPALRDTVAARERRLGELANAAVPDLKESAGGLRDATVLKALVATWLVDVPHVDLERCRQALLDVRDVLHAVNGRPGDRVSPELWPELARALGHDDPVALQRHVRGLGRRMTHLSRLTWRRVDDLLRRPRATGHRGPELVRIGRGLAVSAGEVVLDGRAAVREDPLLLLRAAAEAAERGLVLAPTTAARLARDGVMPEPPWEEGARDLLVRMLAAGPGLVPVWETLDETGALDRLLPEWQRVRLLPHASPIHRFTVDRHLVETCVEAAGRIRRVARPDLLMLVALLHDIGKGSGRDHAEVGEPIATAVAARVGLDRGEQALVGRLVRLHLLLATTATTRDVQDPVTVERVAQVVADVETLELLEVLTEADARATSAQAWTAWRARLVAELASRVRCRLLGDQPGAEDVEVPAEVELPAAQVFADPGYVDVRLAESAYGTAVTVAAADRPGLMAAVAGTFAAQRLSVRAARAWVQDDVAVSVWQVAATGLDRAALRQVLRAILAGAVDPARGLPAPRAGAADPAVQVRHGLSRTATVLEVRADDRPGVVFLVCRALAAMQVAVRSAHVATLGPQAVDVFYVCEPGEVPLAEERAAAAAHAVRRALGAAATLDP